MTLEHDLDGVHIGARFGPLWLRERQRRRISTGQSDANKSRRFIVLPLTQELLNNGSGLWTIYLPPQTGYTAT